VIFHLPPDCSIVLRCNRALDVRSYYHALLRQILSALVVAEAGIAG
jgi:hypothetical protein